MVMQGKECAFFEEDKNEIPCRVRFSDIIAQPGLPAAQLRPLNQSKCHWVTLGGSGQAKLTEIARSCGLAILVVFILLLCLLTIKYVV